jgi:predicted RNA-binding protein
MNYWIISLPRLDLEHCIKIGKFGRNQKWALGRVKSGDKVVCMVSKEWKMIAFGEATSDYYLDTEPCFLKEGLFPDRFDFRANKVSEDKQVKLTDVIEKLSFIKDLAYWAVHFRNGIVQVAKEDWELIQKQSQGVRV